MRRLFLSFFLFMLCTLNAKVHVIGDSHAINSFCNAGDPRYAYDYYWNMYKGDVLIHVPFSIHWTGATTMYRIGRDGVAFLNVQKYNVEEKDTVVFVFGEIDVRCHIGKQRDEGQRLLEEVIDTLVQNYLETIKINQALYADITCVIFNVIPPTDEHYNVDHPYYGTLADRIMITKCCNDKLRELCKYYNFKFLDIYDLYAAKDGSLDPSKSDGGIHIDGHYNAPVKAALSKLLDLDQYKHYKSDYIK